jgi:hypothetical protein
MPPYPEKQSPLLVRLKQKKPLMEGDGATESSPPPTTTHADDGPKLSDTAVKILLKILFKLNYILFRFILINHHHHNNNKMVFLFLLILLNRMDIMKNPNLLLFLQQEDSYLKIVILYSRMILFKLVLKVKL